MKDIFIDAQIANRFVGLYNTNEQYKNLIDWLLTNDKANPQNNAFLLISNTLRNEFLGGNQHCIKKFSICFIYFQLQKEYRLNYIKNIDIKNFKNKYISKKMWEKLRSKSTDKDHVPLVFLSKRKMAISEDEDFLYDLLNFPKLGKSVMVARSPEKLNYK